MNRDHFSGAIRLMSKLMTRILPVIAASMILALPHGGLAQVTDGSVLPFPPVPSASVAGPTLATSIHKRRAQPNHLPADAPNILIILLDDVGFGQADTFGGDIRTATLTELANEGIAYNAFHTTAI